MPAGLASFFQASDRYVVRSRLLDEVALGAHLLGHSAQDAEAMALTALARVGLRDAAGRHPLDLDAGERRLGAVAAAIAHAPAVLLMDEAQRGLDRDRLRLLETIIAEERARNAAILFACHDMDFVGRNADLVVHVAHGGVRTFETSAFFDKVAPEAGFAQPELHVLARGCGLQPPRSSRAFVEDILRRSAR